MYKKITYYIFMILFPVLAVAQQKDCEKYKNGKFKITNAATKKTCYITRDGDTQVERLEDSEDEFNFDIVWIDDCTYTITPSPSAILKDNKLEKVGTLKVKITKTKDSSYVQRVTAVNNPKFRRIDEVFVIPDKKDEKG